MHANSMSHKAVATTSLSLETKGNILDGIRQRHETSRQSVYLNLIDEVRATAEVEATAALRQQ